MTELCWSEGKKTVINPERGWYVQVDTKDEDSIREYYDSEEQFRIVLLALDLSGEENQPEISEEKLGELAESLEECKKIGMAAVVRAAYSFSGENYQEPASFDYVLNHVQQLSKVLNSYKGVVIAVQAGFIGPYGEWHSSCYMETAPDGVPYRVTLISKLLETLDESIAINVRRPMFIREAAFYRLETDRLGLHNDALLSTKDDMGTYTEEGYERAAELSWAEREVKTVINGGETTNISEYTKIDNAVEEFRKLKLTYLNRYYNMEVWRQWKNESFQGWNGADYIREHLGYRLHLSSVKLPEYWRRGRNFTLRLRVENTGFSWPKRKYHPYIAVKLDKNIYYFPIKAYNKKNTMLVMEAEITGEELYEKLPETIELGMCLSREHEIELANDELKFSDGNTWFAAYHYEEKSGRYILER